MITGPLPLVHHSCSGSPADFSLLHAHTRSHVCGSEAPITRDSVPSHLQSSERTAAVARSNGHAPNQAIQLTASKSAIYAFRGCRRERMLRGMHRGLAAADLVSR
jgi:hypothetical protein